MRRDTKPDVVRRNDGEIPGFEVGVVIAHAVGLGLRSGIVCLSRGSS